MYLPQFGKYIKWYELVYFQRIVLAGMFAVTIISMQANSQNLKKGIMFSLPVEL